MVNLLRRRNASTATPITGVRLHGRGTRDANQAVVRTLHDEYRLFTQWRTGLAKGDCVRVTPALYNSAADADRLARALRTITKVTAP